MANRYANLVGSNKIKDEWQKINQGFDAVQAEMDQKADRAFAQVNDLPADTKADTITFEGGTGITITTNPNEKKVTVTATGTATPGAHGSAHTEFGADPIPLATPTEGGLMSAADKAKLDKITPVFDVVGFGADPTGATDSTTAIQEAINAVISSGGGVVYFPKGVYMISTPLVISKPSTSFDVPDNISLIGAKGATIKFNGFSAVIIDKISQIKVEGLMFDGGLSTGSIALEIVDSFQVFVEHNVIHNVQTGVLTRYSGPMMGHEIFVRWNQFYTKDMAGSKGIDMNTYDNYVIGNIIRGFETGIYLSTGSHIISHNHIYRYPSVQYSYGLYINGASNMVISNNYFDNPAQASIYAFETDGRLVVSSNYFLHVFANVPFIEFATNTKLNVWNVSIVDNIFAGVVTIPIKYPSDSYVNSSRKHYIRDNVFLQSSPVATRVQKRATIPAGNTTVSVDYPELPGSAIGYAFATGIGQPVYVQSISEKTVTYAVASAPSSNMTIHTEVVSPMEGLFANL